MKKEEFLATNKTDCYIKLFWYGHLHFPEIETGFYIDENGCTCAKMKLPENGIDYEGFFNKYYNEKRIEDVAKFIFFIPGDNRQVLSFEDIVETYVEDGYLYVSALPDQIQYETD